MTKWILFGSLAFVLDARPARAIDLMGNPDACSLDYLQKNLPALKFLSRPAVNSVMCWRTARKLLPAASVLTRLIKNRTATFVAGADAFDFSVAALTGHKIDSMIRFCENGRVFVAVIFSREEIPGTREFEYLIFEVSPNHFFGFQ